MRRWMQRRIQGGAFAMIFASAVGACQGVDEDEHGLRMFALEGGLEIETGATETSASVGSEGYTTAVESDVGSGSGAGTTTGCVLPELEEVALESSGTDSGDAGVEGCEGVTLPGCLGKTTIGTSTQCNWNWWLDSDGVAPETPGCHEAFSNDECNGGAAFNDTIGEKCLDGDVLVETNPEIGDCHEHECGPNGGPEGHPYLFSCSAYCQGMYGMWGRCVEAPGTCVYGIDSAYCDCGC